MAKTKNKEINDEINKSKIESNSKNENKESNEIDNNKKFEVHYLENKNKNFFVRILIVLLGSAISALAMNLFAENAGLLPAGFTGLSKLIQRILDTYFNISVPFFPINMIFNIIPAILAFHFLGRNFVILSIISVMTSSLLMDVFPTFHITNDIFLSTVLGAAMHAFGYILIYNIDASGGGMDFITMIISNKRNVSILNYVMILNFIILAVSAFFFSLEAALYSVVFQFISTQVLNHGYLRYQRKTCFIVTDEIQPIADDLMRLTHHGITVTKGIGCYTNQEQYLLYMVVSRKDVRNIRRYLQKNSPKAFLNVTDSEQLSGNFYVDPID